MLSLKAGKTFIDPSTVEHDTAFIGIYAAEVSPGKIVFHTAVWKDEDAFLDTITGGVTKPICLLPDILIEKANFVTYFRTNNITVSNTSRAAINNEGFYAYVTTAKPLVPGITWDDWEEVSIEGVPATISHE